MITRMHGAWFRSGRKGRCASTGTVSIGEVSALGGSFRVLVKRNPDKKEDDGRPSYLVSFCSPSRDQPQEAPAQPAAPEEPLVSPQEALECLAGLIVPGEMGEAARRLEAAARSGRRA